jgi:hypothetical protein
MFEGSADAGLLFVLAVTLHNIEEMIWLPGFPYPPPLTVPSPFVFRFAAVVITLVFWSVLAATALGFRLESVLAGFAAAMIVNAVVPHLALGIYVRRYHPGLATAWLLVVPAAASVLSAGGGMARFRDLPFALAAAAGFIGLALSLPVLMWLGKQAQRRRVS